jgi:glutamate--cysteine ligase
MVRELLHSSFCGKNDKLTTWYLQQLSLLKFPIYCSFDIRDAGFKISNVDANVFPAGFNNICPTDKETSISLMDQYLKHTYGSKNERILLVTEEHTQNLFYWENVATIKELIEESGRQVLLAFPRELSESLKVKSATGKELLIHSGYFNSVDVQKFNPDLVVSNNDFSEAHEDWAQTVNVPVNPPRELGWYQRKKSRYFKWFNKVSEHFCEQAGIDPYLMTVKTEIFEDFQIVDEGSVKHLADKVDEMIESISQEYSRRGIQSKPFVFVKNNSGTYGLAVIRVSSGKEILEWNYKSRKKMKAAKGGRSVEEVIIQEGIPSVVTSEGLTAEPVIYMIGCELAGGFLRTHSEKDATESLNSPGAVYRKLCVSDLQTALQGALLENVYGWSARLGLLAIAFEAKEMGIEFKGTLTKAQF